MPKKKITQEDLESLLDVGFSQKNLETFQTEVYSRKTEGMSLFEALLSYCEDKGIEPDIAAKLVTPTMLSDLTQEANALRLLKPSKRTVPLEID